jgi:hypothetical protein
MRTALLLSALLIGCTRSPPRDNLCSLADALDAGGCIHFLLRPGCLEPDEEGLRSVPVVVEVDGKPINGSSTCGELLIAGGRTADAAPKLQLQVVLLSSSDGGFYAAQASLAVNPNALPPDHHSVRLCGVCTGAVARGLDGSWSSVSVSSKDLRGVFDEHMR